MYLDLFNCAGAGRGVPSPGPPLHHRLICQGSAIGRHQVTTDRLTDEENDGLTLERKTMQPKGLDRKDERNKQEFIFHVDDPIDTFVLFFFKGTVPRDFRLQVFSLISFPQAPEYTISDISIFFENSTLTCEYLREFSNNLK